VNDFLKVAYEAGVELALKEAGLRSLSKNIRQFSPGPEGGLKDLLVNKHMARQQVGTATSELAQRKGQLAELAKKRTAEGNWAGRNSGGMDRDNLVAARDDAQRFLQSDPVGSAQRQLEQWQGRRAAGVV
jgi:hypothetical protein